MTKSPTLIKKKEHDNFKVIQDTSYRFDIYIKYRGSFYILFLLLVSFKFVDLRHCSIISSHNYNCSSSCFELEAWLLLDFPFEALFFTSNQALIETAFLINTFNKSNKQQKSPFYPFLKSGGGLPGNLQRDEMGIGENRQSRNFIMSSYHKAPLGDSLMDTVYYTVWMLELTFPLRVSLLKCVSNTITGLVQRYTLWPLLLCPVIISHPSWYL